MKDPDHYHGNGTLFLVPDGGTSVSQREVLICFNGEERRRKEREG